MRPKYDILSLSLFLNATNLRIIYQISLSLELYIFNILNYSALIAFGIFKAFIDCFF